MLTQMIRNQDLNQGPKHHVDKVDDRTGNLDSLPTNSERLCEIASANHGFA